MHPRSHKGVPRELGRHEPRDKGKLIDGIHQVHISKRTRKRECLQCGGPSCFHVAVEKHKARQPLRSDEVTPYKSRASPFF
jgi:hypothetical protein